MAKHPPAAGIGAASTIAIVAMYECLLRSGALPAGTYAGLLKDIYNNSSEPADDTKYTFLRLLAVQIERIDDKLQR